MAKASSSKLPPIFFAQTKFPEASNFEINISSKPDEIKLTTPAPGSKSAVPINEPVVYTLPEASSASEYAISLMTLQYFLPTQNFLENLALR